MAKMAADCGSPTNITPFGPNASGPADFRSAVPCFMSAAGRLPAVTTSTHRAARRRQVTDRMRGSLGEKRARSYRGRTSIIAISRADARGIFAFRVRGVTRIMAAFDIYERAADARRTGAVFHRIRHPRNDPARQPARSGQPRPGNARLQDAGGTQGRRVSGDQ